MSTLFENCRILTPAGVITGFLGVEGKYIDYVGETRPAKAYDKVRNFTGRLMMPAFVNAHTHTPMTLLRGVGSDLSLQEWLFGKVFPIEDRLTAEDINVGSRLAALEMLSCGTGSFTDMYFFPEETARVALESGMKANLCRPVQSFDPAERGEDSARIAQALDLYNAFNGAGEGRILVDFCVHAEYTCTEPVTKYLADIVRERQGNLHVHLSETKKEHEDCVKKYGKTPARWFADLGAFDCGAFCAHCVWVTEEDMDLFLEKGVSVVHNPTSNMKLGSGFAPIQRMLDKGINVALGTDGAASNNNLNMAEELHLAGVIHNGYTGDPTVMKPMDLIKMATLSGAVLQRRYDTGTLEAGKRADICCVSLESPHMQPDLDTAALVAYSMQASDVKLTMVDGKVLYENGQFLTLDKDRILYDVSKTVKRLYS